AIGRVAEATHVRNDDNHIRATRTQSLCMLIDNGSRIEKLQRFDGSWQRLDGCGRRGDTDDSDVSLSAHDDCIVPNPRGIPAVGKPDVRTKESVVRITDPGPQGVDSPVELVIPNRGRRKTHSIVVVHDRSAEREIGHGRSLELVSPVEEEAYAVR